MSLFLIIDIDLLKLIPIEIKMMMDAVSSSVLLVLL